MRRSSPSLQFLAAATSTDATMSFRPSFRRGWNQKPRGFSDRPFCEGGEPFVTGDSHFQSVNDANRGFRPGGGNFSSGGSYRPQHRPAFNPPSHFHPFNPSPQFNPFNPPPPLNPQFNPPPPFNPQFNPPPPFNPRPQSDHPPPLNPWPPSDSPPPLNHPWPPSDPPPPCDEHQQFRPAFVPYQPFRPSLQFRPRPPKPLDYRNWEFANSVPPPHSERFTVLSYNILADYLATSHRHKLYFHIPHHILSWDWRKRNIIFELGLWSADILCFQEVDRFQDLEVELKLRGYSGIWKMRTGNPVDGCAIFWHISRFKLLHEECIEFNKLGLRDNVAQICVLKSVHQNGSNSLSALPTGSTGSNKVVICNIHVLYNPKRGDIKLGQIRLLLERAYAVSKLWDGAPVVLCGDFNCTPKSPLYNYIAEQKLNLSDLPRDKISGQTSAEIRAPGQFSPYAGPQSVHNSVRAPALTDGRNVGQSDSLLNGLEQNGPDSNMENNFVNNLSRPQDVNGQMNVLGYSGIKGQYGNKNSVFPNELTEETHQDAADDCDVHITDSSLKENVSSSHKGGSSVDQMKDITCELTHVDSCHEGMLSNAIETGGGEKFHPTFNAKYDSSSKHSQSNLYTENGSVNCDKGNFSFMRVNHSMDAINYPKHPSSSNLGIASSELSYQTPFSCDVEVSPRGSSETLTALSLSNDNDIPSSLCKDNMACKSTITDSVVDEKMRNLSLDEQVEVKKEDESLGEDSTSFISELHDTGGSLFQSHLNQPVRSEFVESNESSEGDVATSHSQQFHHPGDEFLNDDSSAMFSVPVDAFKTTYEYDPSAWTPMEFETATGNADCMVMEHPLKLRSTYAEVEDCSGTRDPNGEPLVTSYNRCFSGTVDYIWRSEGLQTVKVLAPIPKHAMQWTPGFPTKKWGSDHIALVCELAFTGDAIIQKTETL